MSLGIYHPHHQYDWLFEPPKTIRAEVKINGTFQIQEIPLWRHEPNWRGEVFLTLGKSYWNAVRMTNIYTYGYHEHKCGLNLLLYHTVCHYSKVATSMSSGFSW